MGVAGIYKLKKTKQVQKKEYTVNTKYQHEHYKEGKGGDKNIDDASSRVPCG